MKLRPLGNETLNAVFVGGLSTLSPLPTLVRLFRAFGTHTRNFRMTTRLRPRTRKSYCSVLAFFGGDNRMVARYILHDMSLTHFVVEGR